LVQNGHGEKLGNFPLDPGCILKISRRTVRLYTQRQTELRNGVTPHQLSTGYYSGAGVNRKQAGKGIVSEAKACGKAIGYADGDTATWKVEV